MRMRKQNAFDNIDVLNSPAQRKKKTSHEYVIMTKERGWEPSPRTARQTRIPFILSDLL